MAYNVLVLALALLNTAIVTVGAVLTPVVGAALVMLVVLLHAFLPQGPLGVTLADISIYPQDVVSGILFVSGAVQMVLYRRVSTRTAYSLALVLLPFATSFVWGILQFGPQRAGVDARGFLLFVASTLYFSAHTYHAKRQRSIQSMFAWAASALLVLAFLRWTALMTGFFVWVLDDPANGWRVLNAGQALFLLEVCIISVAGRLYGHAGGKAIQFGFLAYVSPLVLILLQHRTIWVALLIVVLFWGGGQEIPRALRRVLVRGLVVAGSVIALIAMVQWESLLSSLAFYLTEPFNPEGSTLVWRVKGWLSLLSPDYMGSWSSYLIGKPFGPGYARLLNNVIVDVSPHNYYVQTIVRLGAVGLVGLISLYVIAWKQRMAQAETTVFGPQLVRALLVVQVTYFMTYAALPEHGLILGMALGMAAMTHAAPTEISSTPFPGKESV